MGRPDILDLLHLISCADSLEEAQMAFALLAGVDLKAAQGLAITLGRAIPQTGAVWKAILDRAKERNPRSARIKTFDWGQTDAADTADDLPARMGWRDVGGRA